MWGLWGIGPIIADPRKADTLYANGSIGSTRGSSPKAWMRERPGAHFGVTGVQDS